MYRIFPMLLTTFFLLSVIPYSFGADWEFAGSKKRGWISRNQTDVYIDMSSINRNGALVEFTVLQDTVKSPIKSEMQYVSHTSRERVYCTPDQNGRIWWQELSNPTFYTGQKATGRKKTPAGIMSKSKHWIDTNRKEFRTLLRFKFVCEQITKQRY